MSSARSSMEKSQRQTRATMKIGAASVDVLRGVLDRNRARLLELAPHFLAPATREQLVNDIANPQSPHGIVVAMVLTVIAEETHKPRGAR